MRRGADGDSVVSLLCRGLAGGGWEGYKRGFPVLERSNACA